MGKEKKNDERVFICPVGKLFCDMEKMAGKGSQFFSHLDRSRIEFLKAIRSLLDDRIEALEKKRTPHSEQKMTKIEVE